MDIREQVCWVPMQPQMYNDRTMPGEDLSAPVATCNRSRDLCRTLDSKGLRNISFSSV